MRCLYCNKSIRENASDEEKLSRWHKRCVRRFFGTETMPLIDITPQKLEALANETVNKGLAVPGVQKKLSLHLSKDTEARLTIVDYPTGYILKPQTDEYDNLPEFEYLAMQMADLAGIQTVEHALIANESEYSYITKRVDRDFENDEVHMLAMEDFCQLAERLTADKYKGSYEKCAKIVKEHSNKSGIDMAELFIRVVFSFIIGNSDMHLKNFSLIEESPGSRKFGLSPAYDMLPVNIILPEDKEQTALTLNGKKSNIKKEDFMAFAEKCSINKTASEKMIRKLCSLKTEFLRACDESYLSDEQKEKTKNLIAERIRILEQ